MTTAEVSAFLRIPVGTLHYWRHVGSGPTGFKLGRRLMYNRSDVEAFLAAAKKAGRGPDAA